VRSTPPEGRFRVGVDIGGTFTGAAVLDSVGQLRRYRASSVPDDPVKAVDVDRLHGRVVQQRLQPRHPENLVEHLGDHPLLGILRDELPIGHQLHFAVAAHRLIQDRPGQLLARMAIHDRAGALLPRLDLSG